MIFAKQPIFILWDESHIWGLMAWRAVRALGLPCRLVKGNEIAEGTLLRKPQHTRSSSTHTGMLLVPGGNARLKAYSLGPAGREAIRYWLAAGGNYLGFCGGAGLALTQPQPDEGLNICPWTRANYPQRLNHLISGHVQSHVTLGHTFSPKSHVPADGLLSLPVWWPGQFAQQKCPNVQVLGICHRPDKDFWIADLPLQRLPSGTIEHWRSLYGVNLSADFLEGHPLVITGTYGSGRYVLSYSHLETPHSPMANTWLAQIIANMTQLAPKSDQVPLWQLRHPRISWPDDHERTLLMDALRHMRALLDLAVEHHLFFARTHWLWGWRTSLPGASCNHLHAALCSALELKPTPAARIYWSEMSSRFATLEHIFMSGAEEYFLACRLADTLSPSQPDIVEKRWLDHQRESLFGHPMYGRGILSELLSIIEEVIYLSQDNALTDTEVI